MWHVLSRSGVATLRTAIHLLLTYLLTETVSTSADSCVAAAAREAGSAADEAAARKSAKYSNIQAHQIFQPLAVESLGPIGPCFPL